MLVRFGFSDLFGLGHNFANGKLRADERRKLSQFGEGATLTVVPLLLKGG